MKCLQYIVSSRRDELDIVNSNAAVEQPHQLSGLNYDNGYNTYGTNDYAVGGNYAENPYYYSYADNRNYGLVDSDVNSYGYGEGA